VKRSGGWFDTWHQIWADFKHWIHTQWEKIPKPDLHRWPWLRNLLTKAELQAKWRRRISITAVLVVAIAVFVRILIALLLPLVISRVAHAYDLKCDYDRLRLSITGGYAEIWNLQLSPREGGDPLVQSDYCQGDISVLNLFRGRLVIYRLAADGVEMNIQRTADGKIPLLSRFVSSSVSASGASSGSPVHPIQLQPPLRIDALRLAHVRAHFEDQYLNPPFNAQFSLDVRLNNFGGRDKQTQFELDFSSDPVLDLLQIEGHGDVENQLLNAEVNVLMRGLHPKTAAQYLAALGIRPTADDISAYLHGRLQATPAQVFADGIQATLWLDEAKIVADGATAASVQNVSIDASSLTSGSARLGKLAIDGVTLNVHRSADGVVSALGMSIIPPQGQAVAPASDPGDAGAGSSTSSPSSSFRWSLDQLAVTGVHVGYDDVGLSPPVTLGLDVPNFSADGFVCDPDNPGATVHFAATASAPGIARTIYFTGSCVPFAPEKTFQLNAGAQGIAMPAIEPYLNSLGLTSEWKDGAISAQLGGALRIGDDGSVSTDAHLDKFIVADGRTLLALEGAQIAGLGIDSAGKTIQADSIEITGPYLAISRDAQKQVHVLGFVTRPAPVATALTNYTSSPASTSPSDLEAAHHLTLPAGLPPNILIKHFLWKGTQVWFQDSAVNPPATLAIRSVGCSVDNFNLHLTPDVPDSQPGEIRAWFSAGDLVNRAEFSAQAIPGSNFTRIGFAARAQGIHTASIAPYLAAHGLEPTLKNGHAELLGDLIFTNEAGKLAIDLGLHNLRYSDGERTLASVAAVQVNHLQMEPHAVHVDSVAIASPHALVTRDADGVLEAGGVRLIGLPPTAPGQIADDPNADLATEQSTLLPPDFAASVKSAKISGASLEWDDEFLPGSLKDSATLDADLENFSFGGSAAPASLHIAAAVPDSLETLTADGTLGANLQRQDLALEVQAAGVRAGPLADYLPNDIGSNLQDGRFHAELTASATRNPKGGRVIDLQVSKMDWREADAPKAFLGFDSFHVGISRLDLSKKLIALSDVTLKGLEMQVDRTADGLALLGLEFGGNRCSATTRALTVTHMGQFPAVTLSSTLPAASPLPSSPPVASQPALSEQQVLRGIAAERERIPLVLLKTLDLNVRAVTITNDQFPKSAPLVISDVQAVNTAPIAWLGRDPESNPLTQLKVTGKLEPLADSFQVDVKSMPFSRQKTVDVDLDVTGIQGNGITTLIPALATEVDGSSLTKGELQAHFGASLTLRNVRPADFGLDNGGVLAFSLKDVGFKADPDGPVIAGVGEVRADGIAISPQAKLIDAREIEVDNLLARAARSADGVHAFGLVFKIPKAAASSKPAGITAAEAAVPAGDPPAESAPDASGNVRIDRILFDGLDFKYVDDTCAPPLVVPVNNLDAEVSGLSNVAADSDKPVRFEVLLSSGKVKLPARGGSKSTSAAAERELFSQLTADGAVTLYPKPKGWAKASVSGFELMALSALARQQGIALDGGIFDTDMDVRFNGEQAVDVSGKLILTDLLLADSPGGAIEKYLKLPAPVDVAIAAVQDADGSITIPVNVTLEYGHVDRETIDETIAESVVDVTTTAIASLPAKVLTLGTGDQGAPPEPPMVVTYSPGSEQVPSDRVKALQDLSYRLWRDRDLQVTLKPTLGSDDVALAMLRTNPTHQDLIDLTNNLSLRRDALIAARNDAGAQVEAFLASDAKNETAQAIQRLRTIDQQLSDVNDALDQAYDLLRPGADRQAMRRTRAAALSISNERLDALKDLLLNSGRFAVDPGQVHVVKPQFPKDPQDAASSVTISIVETK
jgi:hypothetical protein